MAPGLVFQDVTGKKHEWTSPCPQVILRMPTECCTLPWSSWIRNNECLGWIQHLQQKSYEICEPDVQYKLGNLLGQVGLTISHTAFFCQHIQCKDMQKKLSTTYVCSENICFAEQTEQRAYKLHKYRMQDCLIHIYSLLNSQSKLSLPTPMRV